MSVNDGRKRLLLLATLMLLTAAVPGCLAESGEDTAAPAATPGADTWTTIQSDVLAGCSCHQSALGAGNLSLLPTAYDRLVNADSEVDPKLSIVKRNNRNTSTLYLTANGAAGMPTGMTSADAARIGAWIDAGAPE